MKKFVFLITATLLLFGLAAVYVHSETQTCPNCKGTGKFVIADPCTMCNGKGTYVVYGVKTKCTVCFGAGKFTMPCTGCNGTGKVTVQNNPPPAQSQSSGNSSPGVVVPLQNNNNSSSSGGSTINEYCNSCGGTGLCNGCRGNPWRTCNYCDGVGSKTYGTGSNKSYETCVNCKGSGRLHCAVCEAAWIPDGKCSTCKGSGRR